MPENRNSAALATIILVTCLSKIKVLQPNTGSEVRLFQRNLTPTVMRRLRPHLSAPI